MKKTDNNLIINSLLLKWYEKNKRDLPWRRSQDPYIIWISEIILQQTRINQGWDYFLRFTQRFPNVQSLAKANEDEVLKLWQGLGYYSRARNLHAAAKQIVSQFGGKFPETYPDILSLKGVGEYTAAAIASIAYKQPYAVVDGNVFRVISRLFDVETPINTSAGKKIFYKIAESLLHPDYPGEHNQAMMDLGSMVCTPTKPLCDECPLQTICMAKELKKTSELPVKIQKTAITDRYFNYFHILYKGKTYIKKRSGSDIWKNLYEFPLIESSAEMDLEALSQTQEFAELFAPSLMLDIHKKVSLKHILSHQRIFSVFYKVTIESDETFSPSTQFIEINDYEIFEYPVSRLTDKYLETI